MSRLKHLKWSSPKAEKQKPTDTDMILKSLRCDKCNAVVFKITSKYIGSSALLDRQRTGKFKDHKCKRPNKSRQMPGGKNGVSD